MPQSPSSITSSPSRKRRGIASVLAMLYLTLFSVLAIGFYAGTTLSGQIARNEKNMSDAQLAAETGLQFIRYQLGQLDFTTAPSDSALLSSVAVQLGTMMNGSPNMGGNVIAVSNSAITIPSPTAYMSIDSSGRQKFQAKITTSGSFLIVTATGRGTDGNVTRTIQVKFQKAQRSSAIFNYGVASKGKIVTAGSAIITGQGDPTRGSVLSTSSSDPNPVVIGGKMVSGDISVTNANANVTYSGASVGGTSDPAEIAANHIHKGVTAPDFPNVDTSAYSAYATQAYDGTSTTLNNVYIPAGQNPKFSGNTTITGVLYVKAPNVIDFGGNVTLQGVIVVENDVGFNASKNQLNFTGSVTASGIETLPAAYGNERNLTGAFILAPGFGVNFSGDFGTVSGSIIASQVTFSGNAGGVVKGSIINMDDVVLSVDGSSDIVIASTGTTNYPTGVTFGMKYAPLPDTYAELP